jgi:hypothetical protein
MKVKPFIEPGSLVFNAGNSHHPSYTHLPYSTLVVGDSILAIRDRHSREYAGILRSVIVAESPQCYYVTSFILEKQAGDNEDIDGTVVSALKPLTPQHVEMYLTEQSRGVPASLVLEGYDLYFDGFVGIREVSRLSVGGWETAERELTLKPENSLPVTRV